MASKWRNKCHIFSNIRFDFYCILITFATGIFVYCYIVQIHWSIWEWCSHQIKQSIDTHANHLTGFYVIETLTLIYHFRAMFHLFILSLKTSEKLSEVLGGILKFSQCIEMTNWSEMGNMSWSFNHQCPSHTETSQLICSTNQLTGFYMRGTLVVKELKY